MVWRRNEALHGSLTAGWKRDTSGERTPKYPVDAGPEQVGSSLAQIGPGSETSGGRALMPHCTKGSSRHNLLPRRST